MSATNQDLNQRPSKRRGLVSRDAPDAESVLEALADDASRDILEATTEDSLSATEISTRCDIPLSTTYRKLERLTDAQLVEERIRISADGQHAAVYQKCFEDVSVTVTTEGEPEVEVTRSHPTSTP
ncbi:ArsR/SmtB family transcription factor [Natronobeatus ordinarius]|uniref:ArsR/SmtB family transcription factor n=1 Tax=Natronobeatus ordinarius TaxID=2963433 RepID=UPI0020CF17F3|nr:helix-turn-helix domain-containing protein [Natronobeatus ordinarius]